MPFDLRGMIEKERIKLTGNVKRRIAQMRNQTMDEFEQWLQETPEEEVEVAAKEAVVEKPLTFRSRIKEGSEAMPEFWQMRWTSDDGYKISQLIEESIEPIEDLKTFRTASRLYIVPAQTIEAETECDSAIKISAPIKDEFSQDARIFLDRMEALYAAPTLAQGVQKAATASR